MKDIIILGVHKGPHNASVALLKNNDVIFHIESERLSNIKYDRFPFQAISQIKKYVDHIDYLAISGLNPTLSYDEQQTTSAYAATVYGLGKTFLEHDFEVFDAWEIHHNIHAFTSFYNSGFDKALCIVKDAFGSPFYWMENEEQHFGKEISSSYVVQYPASIELVEKEVTYSGELENDSRWLNEKIKLVNGYSEALAFEEVAKKIGFNMFDAGKVMGLAPYGKKDELLPPIYKNNIINNNLFKYLNDDLNNNLLDINIDNDFQSKANLAYALQSSVQDNVAKYILSMLKKTGQKNLCLSGGFFLNCVSNYNLLKQLPKDIKIYVEPISGDAGNSIGVAKFLYYYLTESMEKKPQNNIYYGLHYNYTLDDLKNEKIISVTSKDIAKLISEKNIVAIYQGRSESGPRALGNRTILYDPRDPNGKDHVNIVKKRESFRPFAGSVLKEYAKEWFNLLSLDESKYMMFAVDVWQDKQSSIPAITHIDGTCRVQTVDKLDNPNYYQLIHDFYNLTNVPILFNTSFNLAGDAIVETLEDALRTVHNSEIDYLYLPDLGVAVIR
jgi:carbamoyltransferase